MGNKTPWKFHINMSFLSGIFFTLGILILLAHGFAPNLTMPILLRLFEEDAKIAGYFIGGALLIAFVIIRAIAKE